MSSPLLINVNNVNGRGCTLLSIRKGCLGGRGALPTIEKGYPISIISYILSWKSAQLRLTPLHSIIGIYILFTLLFTFSLILTRRICLSIKAWLRLVFISFIFCGAVKSAKHLIKWLNQTSLRNVLAKNFTYKNFQPRIVMVNFVKLFYQCQRRIGKTFCYEIFSKKKLLEL